MLKPTFWSVIVAVMVLFSVPIYAQNAAQDALATFPADTQQISYTNLAELRTVPQYPLIHSHLLSAPLQNLETLLRSAGVDPEKDVNELVLGWRGQVQDTTRFFGLAEGNFQPDQIHEFFAKSNLPIQRYSGYDLYAFGSGVSNVDLFFTFLDSSTAVFGRIGDLKVLLDVRNAERPPLNTNDDFRRWEGDLEGLAPQWGIATGQAAANEAIPWLTQGRKTAIDPNALFGSVKAVLYRVNWSGSVMAHLSLLCKDDAAANGFGQLFTLLQGAQPAVKSSVSPALSSLLQNMQIQVEGSRVNLEASASVSDLTQLLNAPVANSAH